MPSGTQLMTLLSTHKASMAGLRTAQNHSGANPRSASWLVLALGLLSCQLCGCGGEATGDAALDEVTLMERYEAQGRRHDPENYIELDLGPFFVTRKIADSSDTLIVRCHLYAVAPQNDQEDLVDTLAIRQKRMRDTVIEVIQTTDVAALSESSMNWIRSEIIPAINKVLHTRSVRDIVFSDFSLERA